jgi:hypothetical protein
MTLHLIKLSVGSESVETLRAWQEERLHNLGRLFHATRMMPRRRDELLDGGSIYWVIKGLVRCRQTLTGIEKGPDALGRERTLLQLDPELVLVEPRSHRPFQGWRDLAPEDAPPDLAGRDDDLAEMPPALLEELRGLGLL